MTAGPKRAVSAGPLDLSGLPERGADRVVAFVEEFCKVPKGHGAGEALRVRPWQREIIAGLFDDPRPRQGLVSIPRGNGKSTLAAALALYALHADEVIAPSVLVVASDQRQATIILDAAKAMTALDSRLAERTRGFQDRLTAPLVGGELRTLPATVTAIHGYDPSLLLVDELHAVSADLWETATTSAGKRPQSLALAISTPADTRDSVMWSLVEHGRTGDDPSFYFREWAAPAGCAVDDEIAWHEANPALGDFLAIDAMRATVKTTREGPFRRLRLGQWVGQIDAWLAPGMFEDLADPTRRIEGPVVLGFDGSASGDSTVLVGATMEADPLVFLLGAWERGNDPRWRVPRAEVDQRVTDAMETYDVAELACDPWGWRSEIETWASRWPGRVIEVPTNVVSRMGPATDRTYQLIADRRLSHDGDETLVRHVRNAVAHTTTAGDVVTKDARNSTRRIDACVAMILALDRAAWHLNNRPNRSKKLMVIR